MSKYYVHMKTKTHADVFAAVGLARLLDSEEHQARISTEGDHFTVEGRDIDDKAATELAQKNIYRFIDDGKSTPPPGVPAYDLGETRKVEQKKRQERETLNKEIAKSPAMRRAPDIQRRLEECASDPEYRLHNVFTIMQADGGAAKALLYKGSQSSWLEELTEALRRMKERNRELPDVRLGASGNQLINPLIAKGSYGTKPSGTSRGNPGIRDTGDTEILQYLRYGGYFSSAAPYLDKDGNLRLLAPVPKAISLPAFELVVHELRRSRFGVSRKLKLDVLAALRVADLLIEHSEFARSGQSRFAGLFMTHNSPADLISGLYVSHYLKTSQFGKNVTELSFIAMPGWFPITSAEDADTWRNILEEHGRVLRGLNESFSEEIALLQQYRRFLQIRGNEAFPELMHFVGSYGAYWMSAANDARRTYPMPRFSISHIERMAQSMAPNIAAILQDPGFQSIARAIRKSTVSAQAQKAMGKKPWREIRYGLIAELNRKRFIKEDLLEALGVFIAQYNAENARRRETQNSLQAAPPNVTTEDLESIARLVDETDSPALIGSLLCAYGTCREPAAEPEELKQAEAAAEETIEETEEVEEE